MDFGLLESHRANFLKSYKLAKAAASEGKKNKAQAYLADALSHCNFVVENSPDADERKRYRELRESCKANFSGAGAFANKEETSSQAEGASSAKVIKSEPISLKNALEKLNSLVGLREVKRNIFDWVDQIKVFQMRRQRALSVPEMSYHMIFTGNPGAGKTTVARLMAQIYCALGILSEGQLVEVDREGLVAGYVGQTAVKTKEVLQKAHGGMLFIDEAYALANGGPSDFGHESIDTILKEMEDNRGNLVVVAAGYDEPMEKFISSNPGLRSRFKNFIHFSDYNGAELLEIFERLCKKNEYQLEAEAQSVLCRYFKNLYENRDKNFGNGRDVRNLFETIVTKQSVRIAGLSNPTNQDIVTIKRQDLPIT